MDRSKLPARGHRHRCSRNYRSACGVGYQGQALQRSEIVDDELFRFRRIAIELFRLEIECKHGGYKSS